MPKQEKQGKEADKQEPRIALVHDWLNQKAGGAEQVLAELADIYPDAPIYTMIYNPEYFDYPRSRIHTSILQYMPKFLKQRSRYLLPLIPLAIRLWRFKGYDIVLSSSAAFMKNISTAKDTLHICYCHSPMRFAWDYWPDYLYEQNVGFIRKAAIILMVKWLRWWDIRGVKRVDAFIANSKTVQQRILKYYQKESTVINPPTKVKTLQAQEQDYYITLGMLTPYKKIDLAIEAFNQSGRKLKVLADGPDRPRLEAIAEDNIEFTGFVSSQEKDNIVASAKGLIFPNIEDFGIAPIDAMAAGTPVIAYGRGGVTETVIEGETGIFFHEQTPTAINQAIDRLETMSFDVTKLHQRAREFSIDKFHQSIKGFVDRKYEDYANKS
ncbi:MAG: glycosyltransferase [Candidatus Saccharimonadales bacterium]